MIRKPWVTKDMINKMKGRKEWKSKNTEEGKQRYRQLNNELRRETDKAKEEWWSKECDELDELNSKGRSDLVYAKVAKLTWNKRVVNKSVVADDAGNRITESEEVRERQRMYTEQFYDKGGKPKLEELQVEEAEEVEEDDKGPGVIKNKILAALRNERRKRNRSG